MFERFTDRARQSVILAQEEARDMKHNVIGTEHLLMGLLREGEGIAARVLGDLGVTLEAVRTFSVPGETEPRGHIPFTPRAKKSMEFALREGLQLGHPYIGTEHLLLGLLRDGEGPAVDALAQLDRTPVEVRKAVITALAGSKEPDLDDIDLTAARALLRENSARGAAVREKLGLALSSTRGRLLPGGIVGYGEGEGAVLDLVRLTSGWEAAKPTGETWVTFRLGA